MKCSFKLLVASFILIACNKANFRGTTLSNEENQQQQVEQSTSNTQAEQKYQMDNSNQQDYYNDRRDNDYGESSMEQQYDPDQTYYEETRNGQVIFQSTSKAEIDAYKQAKLEAERRAEEAKKNDWHNWESEEIKDFYIEIECNSSDEAENISERYSNGDYLEEYGRYFIPTDVRNGVYEVEISEKVTNRLYKLRGTEIFVYFKWNTSLWKWDEGVMDVWNNHGSFYKKPD